MHKQIIIDWLRRIAAIGLIAASAMVFVLVIGGSLEKWETLKVRDNQKAAWTCRESDNLLPRPFMYGMILECLDYPGQIVFEDRKRLADVKVSLAQFKEEDIQIEHLDLTYQVYKIEQGKEVLVYSQDIPYPAQALRPRQYYDYEFYVDYWAQNTIAKTDEYILQIKHSDECDYILTDSGKEGCVQLGETSVVRHPKVKITFI